MKKEIVKNKRWWFKKAKKDGHDWADAAIKNIDGADRIIKESLSDALICAFSWSSSKEGFGFWDKIYDDLQSKGL